MTLEMACRIALTLSRAAEGMLGPDDRGAGSEGMNAERTRYPACDLGLLPVDVVNVTLGTELEPGRVRLSEAAHRHMAEDHPADYAACFTALRLAVASPSFLGQAPGLARNFEMVRRTNRPDGKAVLVAIGLEPDQAGDYRVRSCYLVTADTVDARRRVGRLMLPRPG